MASGGNDAKFFTRGKIQEFKAELQDAAKGKDKKFAKRKVVLKKIVANITMGNDSSYLFMVFLYWTIRVEIWPVSQMFPEVIQCLPIPMLEIKKSEVQSHLCLQYMLSVLDSGLSLPCQLWTRPT